MPPFLASNPCGGTGRPAGSRDQVQGAPLDELVLPPLDELAPLEEPLLPPDDELPLPPLDELLLPPDDELLVPPDDEPLLPPLEEPLLPPDDAPLLPPLDAPPLPPLDAQPRGAPSMATPSRPHAGASISAARARGHHGVLRSERVVVIGHRVRSGPRASEPIARGSQGVKAERSSAGHARAAVSAIRKPGAGFDNTGAPDAPPGSAVSRPPGPAGGPPPQRSLASHPSPPLETPSKSAPPLPDHA
jgi:hypothetical protein